MNDSRGPGSGFRFTSPLRSSTDKFHPRSPGLKGRVDVYRVSTHMSLCLCAFGAMDQMTYIPFFFFSDLYTSVVLYIESMSFCESSVGKGAVWVDLSRFDFYF